MHMYDIVQPLNISYVQVCIHTYIQTCPYVIVVNLINEMHEIQLSVYFPVDEWTMEEKVVFERAFHMHGKHFHRIKAFVSIMVAAVICYTKPACYM